MPGYFVLAASLSSAFLLHPRGLPVGPAKTLEAENKLGIPGIMAEAGGPPGGGIAADVSDDDGLAHGGMPGGMAGGIAAGTSDDTAGIAGGTPGGGIIAAAQGAKHC